MSKRILFFILFSWLASAAFPAFAQQKTDTVYTFRFVPRKDMFYVPLCRVIVHQLRSWWLHLRPDAILQCRFESSACTAPQSYRDWRR